MTRKIFIYGLVLGSILLANMFYMVHLIYDNPNFKSNDIVGYAALILVFSLVFFGIRNYRNKNSNGSITFGKALLIGILIALVASTLYVSVWLVYYYCFVPDFVDKYIAHVMNSARADGATASEIATKSNEMAQFKEMYKSPFFVIAITYAEVFPIGILVSLVSALVLKRRPKPQTGTQNA